MSVAKNSSRVDNEDVCSVDCGRLHSRWVSRQTATTHECLGPAWIHCTIMISPGKLTKSSEHHRIYSSAPRRGQRRPCEASGGKVPEEAGAESCAGGFFPELSRELAERRVVCSRHRTSRTHRPFGNKWSPQLSENIFRFSLMHQRLILWKVSTPKRIWSNPNYSLEWLVPVRECSLK